MLITACENNVSKSPSKQLMENKSHNEGELSNHQEDALFFYLLCTCVFWRHWHSECSRLLQYQNWNQLLVWLWFFSPPSHPPDSSLRKKKQPIRWWLIEPVTLRARYSLITEQVWRKWRWRIICLCFLSSCPHQSDGIDTQGDEQRHVWVAFISPANRSNSELGCCVDLQTNCSLGDCHEDYSGYQEIIFTKVKRKTVLEIFKDFRLKMLDWFLVFSIQSHGQITHLGTWEKKITYPSNFFFFNSSVFFTIYYSICCINPYTLHFLVQFSIPCTSVFCTLQYSLHFINLCTSVFLTQQHSKH